MIRLDTIFFYLRPIAINMWLFSVGGVSDAFKVELTDREGTEVILRGKSFDSVKSGKCENGSKSAKRYSKCGVRDSLIVRSRVFFEHGEVPK